MLTQRQLVAAILLPAILVSSCAWAGPPAMHDWDFPSYRAALDASTDPEAIAIRQEIANGPADLAKAEALAQSAGILTSLPDDAPPDSLNAAPIYQEWYTAQKSKEYTSPMYLADMSLKYQYTQDQIAAAKAYTEGPNDSLLMGAIQKPDLYYPPQRNLALKYGRPLRQATRLIRSKSVILAADRQTSDAIAMQANGFAIEGQVAQQKGQLAYLVVGAIRQLNVAGLQEILCNSEPDANNSQSVIKIISSAEDIFPLERVAREEPAVTIYAITLPKAPNYTAVDQTFFQNFCDACEARILFNAESAIKNLDLPREQRRQAFSSFPQSDPNWVKESFGDISGNPIDFAAGAVNYGKLVYDDDSDEAKNQVLLAGASVLAVRAHTGSYPATLPGSFVDPFGGKQLVYRQTDNGFVVYSVGPSGKYDGTPDKDVYGPDAVFTYPAPPKVPVPQDWLTAP
jgi:hypothetical protein